MWLKDSCTNSTNFHKIWWCIVSHLTISLCWVFLGVEKKLIFGIIILGSCLQVGKGMFFNLFLRLDKFVRIIGRNWLYFRVSLFRIRRFVSRIFLMIFLMLKMGCLNILLRILTGGCLLCFMMKLRRGILLKWRLKDIHFLFSLILKTWQKKRRK